MTRERPWIRGFATVDNSLARFFKSGHTGSVNVSTKVEAFTRYRDTSFIAFSGDFSFHVAVSCYTEVVTTNRTNNGTMLNIRFKATNMELTPAIRDYAETKVRMLERLLDARDEDPFVQVEIGKTTQHHQSGEIFRAELDLSTSHTKLRATSEKEDLYAAIDTAKDELEYEIQKGKEKRTSMLRKGGRIMKNLMRRFGMGE